MNLNYIFIDESFIYTQNNIFRSWKLPEDEIFMPIQDFSKKNLLLAVDKNKTIFFKLSDKPTTSIEFKNFFTQMLSSLNDNEIINSIFILDNHSSHLTSELFQLYDDKKLKILFTVPYLSKFNMIELVFRGIINIIYKSLFKSIKEVENKVEEFIMIKSFILLINFILKKLLIII